MSIDISQIALEEKEEILNRINIIENHLAFIRDLELRVVKLEEEIFKFKK
jgi:hypothetical protein